MRAETQDEAKREVSGVFVSLSLEDLLCETRSEREQKFCDMSCCPVCPQCCDCSCCKLTCCPEPFENYFSMNLRLWKMSASQHKYDDLTRLVRSEEHFSSMNPEALVYNAAESREMRMPTTTASSTYLQRYHTLNLSYIDGLEKGVKRRCVVVLAPDEDTTNAIDLVCQLTMLTDMRPRMAAEDSEHAL